MNTKRLTKLYFILLLIAVFCMSGMWYWMHSNKYTPKDYSQIKKEGKLKVVTTYNSIDYYVSGDTIKGFQYDLCKFIEKQSGLSVEIYLENNLEKSIQGLKDLEYDVIARNIPVTTSNQNWMVFTEPISVSKQILVQRKAEYNTDKQPIRNQIELAKKTLYIPQNSPGILRIRNLAEEIADTIYIMEEKQYDSEQLLYMVAKGDIDYAVVDKEIAQKNKENLPQLDIETDISFTQLQAWALRKDSPMLLDSINNWLKLYQINRSIH